LAHVEVDVEKEWARLRKLCSSALGIERTEAKMRALPDQLEALSLLPLTNDRNLLELRAGAITARLVARAALLRTESRGGHYRTDHPNPDPDWAGVRLRLSLH
jgi:L-aspartate oxidase